VTIFTVALLAFGIHNMYSFYMGLSEYKSTIGFYIFSTTALIGNCVNGWFDTQHWKDYGWQITALITHYSVVCMALCQGICFVIINYQLIALRKER